MGAGDLLRTARRRHGVTQRPYDRRKRATGAAMSEEPRPEDLPWDPGQDKPLRAYQVLATLREHHVEFVVIGGIALAAHGYIRGTKDVDIVPEPSPENLQRLLG